MNKRKQKKCRVLKSGVFFLRKSFPFLFGQHFCVFFCKEKVHRNIYPVSLRAVTGTKHLIFCFVGKRPHHIVCAETLVVRARQVYFSIL